MFEKKQLIKSSISLLKLLKLDLFKFKQTKSNSTLTNNLYQDFVFMFNGNIIYKYFKTIYSQLINTGLDNVLAVEVSILQDDL